MDIHLLRCIPLSSPESQCATACFWHPIFGRLQSQMIFVHVLLLFLLWRNVPQWSRNTGMILSILQLPSFLTQDSDALENVISATMEFLANAPAPSTDQDILTSSSQAQSAIDRLQHKPRDPNAPQSPSLIGTAPESFVRGSPTTPATTGEGLSILLGDSENDGFGYLLQAQQQSPSAEGRWEGRHGELGQMDAEWMLSLCEADGFSLQTLNEMMRFEPTLGA